MSVQGNCGCSVEQVDLMLKKAEQYIDEEITDRTPQLRRYWVDLYPVKLFVDGAGLILDKLRFYGDIGPQYDGYDGWRQVQISRHGVDAALRGENDGCGYVWEDVGHGMETVSYSLMQRDLRTKPICIKDIRTFFQYQQTQELIYRNLTNISANMREQLNRNTVMNYSIKHVALPGVPVNTTDPHQLPVIPSGVELGKLTYRLLLQLYHPLAQEASQNALTTLEGYPGFGVIAHPDTLHDMIYEDPEIKATIRECKDGPNSVCNLISKYNFVQSVGPFVLMPDLYAPRYDRDANGVLSRVFPYDRNMPIEIGTRPITNPAYHEAEFELVLFLTKDLFTLRTRRPLNSVGGETDFDSEVGLFQWKWHNPDRCEDPYRRTGRYVTTGEIGVEPGDFTSIPALLIKRRPRFVGIEYWGPEVCPPIPEDCDNALPAGDCPCPQVVGVAAAVRDDELLIQFDRNTGVSDEATINLNTPNGSYISGTVKELNADKTKLQVRFASAIAASPGMFTELRCADVDYCSASVLKTEVCGLVDGTLKLVLNRPLRVEDDDTVTLNMCDGTTQDVSISVSNLGNIEYTVELDFSVYCEAQGICSVCVPTETEATCPDCAADGFEECS